MIMPHGVNAKIIVLLKERQASKLANRINNKATVLSRRQFIKSSIATASAVVLTPTIVPSSVFAANAPSNRIIIGMIGMGRQAYHSNLKAFLNANDTQVVAVCDVDAWRLDNAKKAVDKHYAKGQTSGTFKGCSKYKDFRVHTFLARAHALARSIFLNKSPYPLFCPLSPNKAFNLFTAFFGSRMALTSLSRVIV